MIINEKFKSLLMPLSKDEISGLERSILDNGVIDPLIVWQGEGVLIDGHNRYSICQKHDIEFETVELPFEDEKAVHNWIIEHQLSRRNVTPEQASYLRGKRYLTEKKDHGGDRKSKGQNVPLIEHTTTADKIAAEYKVSDKTIKRDAAFVESVDSLEEIEPGLRNEVLTRDSGFTKKDVIEIAKVSKRDPEKAKAIIQEVKTGEAKSAIAAIKKETIKAKKAESEQIYKEEVKEDKRPVVHLMDCIEYLNAIDDNSIDLLLTDPPYSTDVKDINGFVQAWLPLAIKKVKPTGRAFICIGAYPEEISAYLERLLVPYKFTLDSPLIWTYRNTLGQTPNMKYNLNYQMILHLYSKESGPLDKSVTNEMFSVQDINAPDGRLGDRYHTWQKPDELARRLISHASKEGDRVVDCFACTGTFLLMAAKMGRVAEGCDNSKENLKIAEQRGCNVKS